MHIPTHTKARKMERNQRARWTIEMQLFWLFLFGCKWKGMCTRWIFALQKVKWFLHKIYRRAYLTPRARADAAEVVQVPRHCHMSLVICQTEDRPPQANFFFLKIISFSSRSFVRVTPEWLHPWHLATPFLGLDFKAKQRCALWMAQGQGGWKPRAKKEKSWLRSGRKSTFLVLFFWWRDWKRCFS